MNFIVKGATALFKTRACEISIALGGANPDYF